jgi:hypothetical protein
MSRPQERKQAVAEFWAGAREKIAVARRQVAEGQTHDGEQAMDEILAELHERRINPRPDD